jgi:hypothetical protein
MERDAPQQHPDLERLTILFALAFTQARPNTKVTRAAYPVAIAGRKFYRSDLSSGDKSLSVFVTWYRKYAVVAWAHADSPKNLEEAAVALCALTLGEDERSGDCLAYAN